MKSFRLVLLGLFATLATGSFSGLAQADGTNNPFSNKGNYPTLLDRLNRPRQPQLPVYQAAPWYLYWPYDAHFLTPAPIGGAFYGPPVPGNVPVNPYFPQPALPYGPIPGGAYPGPGR